MQDFEVAAAAASVAAPMWPASAGAAPGKAPGAACGAAGVSGTWALCPLALGSGLSPPVHSDHATTPQAAV